MLNPQKKYQRISEYIGEAMAKERLRIERVWGRSTDGSLEMALESESVYHELSEMLEDFALKHREQINIE